MAKGRQPRKWKRIEGLEISPQLYRQLTWPMSQGHKLLKATVLKIFVSHFQKNNVGTLSHNMHKN